MNCLESKSALEIKTSELDSTNKRLTEAYKQIMGQAQLVQKLYYRLEFKSKPKAKNTNIITIDDSQTKNNIKRQLCNYKSSTETDATNHVKEKHAHRCKKCLKEFKNKHELCKHVSSTHGPKKSASDLPAAKTCNKCQKEFSSEKDLKSHMDTEHRTSNLQLECPICNYSCLSETDIAKHIDEKHAFKCKECNKEFLSCDDLVSHDYEEHRAETMESSMPSTTTCTYCEHIFPSKNELDTHILSVHGTRNKPYDCPICNYRSTSEADVTNHVEEHHTFKCKDCPTECSSQEELDNHISEIHYTEPVSTYKCNRCGHEFGTENELKQHMSIVHDQKGPQSPHNCAKCRERFSHESELESHIKTTHITTAKVKNNLLLADSLSKYQNPRLIEKALGGRGLFTPGVTQPRTGRAYCSTREWPNSRYPDNNLMDKAMEELGKREHSHLIFGAPINDISNLVKVQSQEEQYTLAVKSSENCNMIAERALKEFPMLEKVIIPDRLARADNLSELSEFSNFALRSLAEKSQLKSRIVVVQMEILHFTTDEEMEDIFGSTSAPRFDGVHPKGRLGGQLYNDCLIAAITTAGIATRRERGQGEQGISTRNRFSQLN